MMPSIWIRPSCLRPLQGRILFNDVSRGHLPGKRPRANVCDPVGIGMHSPKGTVAVAEDISLTRSRLKIAVPLFWKIPIIRGVFPSMIFFKPLFLALTASLFLTCVSSSKEPIYDIVVYGDSSGAAVAAISAKRDGRSVIWLNPTSFPGGMSSSGLGATDFLGRRNTFGGIASEFYDAIAAAYGEKYVRSFEPKVGLQVFKKMIADAGVEVVYNERLYRTPGKGVEMNGKKLSPSPCLAEKLITPKCS